MDKKEFNLFIEQLRIGSKIEIPKFENPSISIEGLIETREKYKIKFQNGEYYDKTINKLYLKNNEIFVGKIKEGKIFSLVEGIYTWPSGQKFEGKFLKNNEYSGELKYDNNCIYKGKFKDKFFEGNGKFFWGNDEYIEGKFSQGKINGKGILQRENLFIEGNFKDSNLEGKVEIFKIKLNNHDYEFPPFNFINEKIKEEKLRLEKDGNPVTLNNKDFKIKIDKKRNRILVTENELQKLKNCFNLLDKLIPKIEVPSIPKEGLIKVKEDESLNIEFKNGAKCKFDEEKDEFELSLSNDEKFRGMLDDDGENNYWLLEGTYTWPSGQEYSGKFNQNNEFNSEDVELRKENEWIYKGGFENGKLKGHGKFEWNEGNNYLEAYFSDGKIYGNTSIKWNEFNIKGVLKDSTINEFQAEFDNHVYKIRKIDKKIVDNLIYIEKDENEYILSYFNIKENQIIIEEYKDLDQEEKCQLLSFLISNSNINLPDFEPFSINNNELIVENENDFNEDINEINFKNGIIYNKETKILLLQNGEKFTGTLKFHKNKYYLEKGEYEWPSGQKYLGKFDENNYFDGDSEITFDNNCKFKGFFRNGKPNGQGEFLWENGDYIKGNFENGKIFGIANYKKNGISFDGNYTSSVINGNFNNINIQCKNNNYQIPKITINKGMIKEDYLDLIEKNRNKIKIRLNKENKRILSEGEYKKFEYNENDIIILFKSLSKIRKMNISYYSQISIPEEGLILDKNNININNNKNNNLKLTFSNNEIFKGKIEEYNGKFFLVMGEYEWPSGQKYIGKFCKNRFDCDNGKLSFKNEWEYNGNFKNGHIEGFGIFENNKNEIIQGYFQKGKIKTKIMIKSNTFFLDGVSIDSINDLYIKSFIANIQGHNYEIIDFKMNDKKIKFKRDGIKFEKEISNELKIKIIDSLLIKTKSNNQKFYYNEPFKKNASNENKIKILKIQDNINSQKLSKLSIYHNRLSNENRKIKDKIGKIIGVDINEEISSNDLLLKLKLTYDLSKKDKKNLETKIRNIRDLNQSSKDSNYNEIEKNEIIKICNSKMIKEMEEEIRLINQDIITLRKEREIIEDEKNNKIKEVEDLKIYYKFLSDSCKNLENEKLKMEEDDKKAEEDLKNLIEENDYLSKYLDNLKAHARKNNKNKISKKIRDLENENNKILKELKEKEEIDNNEKKEIEQWLKKIKNLEEKVENQNK